MPVSGDDLRRAPFPSARIPPFQTFSPAGSRLEPENPGPDDRPGPAHRITGRIHRRQAGTTPPGSSTSKFRKRAGFVPQGARRIRPPEKHGSARCLSSHPPASPALRFLSSFHPDRVRRSMSRLRNALQLSRPRGPRLPLPGGEDSHRGMLSFPRREVHRAPPEDPGRPTTKSRIALPPLRLSHILAKGRPKFRFHGPIHQIIRRTAIS